MGVANAIPEQGFSENKYILEGRERLDEETIESIRLVKNTINLYGGASNIPITRKLVKCISKSHQKMLDANQAKKDLYENNKRHRTEAVNDDRESKRKALYEENRRLELQNLKVSFCFFSSFSK